MGWLLTIEYVNYINHNVSHWLPIFESKHLCEWWGDYLEQLLVTNGAQSIFWSCTRMTEF